MVEWMAVAIACLSLLVSFYFAWKTRQDAKQHHQELLEIQRRQAELQEITTNLQVVEASAREVVLTSGQLDVTVEGWGTQDPHIVIANIGGATTEDVNLEFEYGHGFPLVSGDFEEILPLKRLEPGQRCRLMADSSLPQPAPPWEGFVTWKDPAGGDRRKLIILYP